jgi:hypothetical protein
MGLDAQILNVVFPAVFSLRDSGEAIHWRVTAATWISAFAGMT